MWHRFLELTGYYSEDNMLWRRVPRHIRIFHAAYFVMAVALSAGGLFLSPWLLVPGLLMMFRGVCQECKYGGWPIDMTPYKDS